MSPARFNHVEVKGTTLTNSFCESCHKSVGTSARSDVLRIVEKVHARCSQHHKDRGSHKAGAMSSAAVPMSSC